VRCPPSPPAPATARPSQPCQRTHSRPDHTFCTTTAPVDLSHRSRLPYRRPRPGLTTTRRSGARSNAPRQDGEAPPRRFRTRQCRLRPPSTVRSRGALVEIVPSSRSARRSARWAYGVKHRHHSASPVGAAQPVQRRARHTRWPVLLARANQAPPDWYRRGFWITVRVHRSSWTRTVLSSGQPPTGWQRLRSRSCLRSQRGVASGFRPVRRQADAVPVCSRGCAFLLIPHQSETALAVELIMTGLLIWAVLMAIVVRSTRVPSRQPRSWHLTRFAVLRCHVMMIFGSVDAAGRGQTPREWGLEPRMALGDAAYGYHRAVAWTGAARDPPGARRQGAPLRGCPRSPTPVATP
jgi:hypothetical protein